MTVKTITKICKFVIVSSAFLLVLASCSTGGRSEGNDNPSGPFAELFSAPEQLGTINDNELRESSGIAASRCNDNVLWTHNDSGDGAYIFAIGTDASVKGVWQVTGAQAIDWEDIASARTGGSCELFIGDIGDNSLSRKQITIYRVAEPEPGTGGRNEKSAGATAPATEIRLSYPDGPHDAESLLVDQRSQDLYIVTKSEDGPAGVYRARGADWQAAGNQAVRMKKLADLSVPAFPPGFVTGGDISPDGRRVILCDYFNAYEYTLPKGEEDLSGIWNVTPSIIDAGRREQGEAVTYSADGNAIFLTSENKQGKTPLIEVRRK